MFNKSDFFKILRKINNSQKITQRELARDLNFSLGKLNYCLKALQKKGFVKISNFKKNSNKIKYMYLLTPKGITQKTKLTILFMKEKIKEYNELKKELKDFKKQNRY